MFKKITAGILSLTLCVPALISPVAAAPATPENCLAMRRLYNPNSGEHFYTSDQHEYKALIGHGWTDEGFSWYSPESSNVPVYRLYNENAGDHHYTISEQEREALVSFGWKDEGIGWYSYDEATGVPVYREYNPNATAGSHNYTPDFNEHRQLGALGWTLEDIGWYAAPQTSALVLANQKEASLDASQLDDYTLPKNVLRKCNQVTNSLTSYQFYTDQASFPYQSAFQVHDGLLYETTQYLEKTPDAIRMTRNKLNSVRYPFSDAMFSHQDSWGTLIQPGGIVDELRSPSQNAGLVGTHNPIYLSSWVFDAACRYRFESRNSGQAVIVIERGALNSYVRSLRWRVTIDGSFHIVKIEQENTIPDGSIEKETQLFGGFNENLIDINAVDHFFSNAENGQIQNGSVVPDAKFMLTEKGRQPLC